MTVNASKPVLSPEQIERVGKILHDVSQPLKARYRAMYILRNLGCDQSIDLLSKCFNDASALLKHEVAYCIGQTRNAKAVPLLCSIMDDSKQEAIVRHEAGEALGAIGDPAALPTLEKYLKDESQAVAETCVLAIGRIRWATEKKEKGEDFVGRSPYNSVDPTPASTNNNVKELGETLVDPKKPLWDRYVSMFSLRNINTDEAIKTLAKGLSCPDSALFRHEVAYVLGQAQSPVAIEELRRGLEDLNENHMVRHECAEALGAIATDECIKALEKFVDDKERVVSESCIIALDMADYENSAEFQYATVAA